MALGPNCGGVANGAFTFSREVSLLDDVFVNIHDCDSHSILYRLLMHLVTKVASIARGTVLGTAAAGTVVDAAVQGAVGAIVKARRHSQSREQIGSPSCSRCHVLLVSKAMSEAETTAPWNKPRRGPSGDCFHHPSRPEQPASRSSFHPLRPKQPA